MTTPAAKDSTADSPHRDRRGRVALFAALTAAHAQLLDPSADTGLLVAWERPAGADRIRIVFGGNPHFPPAVQTGIPIAPVMYPPGSTARVLDATEVISAWSQIPVWLRCAGRPDALWTAGPGTTAQLPGRGGFEDYIAHMPGAFVWLVLAQPQPASTVDAELAALEVQLPRWRARENSEPDRIAAARGESRYRELARARSPGVWAVHILVGGTNEHSTRLAAGLLCSASDLDDLPYVLSPTAETGSLTATWDTIIDSTSATDRSPFLASTELLAALARPPIHELPGIRAIEPATFDLTPERDDGEIDLGTILDNADQPAGRLRIGLDTLNRHGFVAGATGSGKSQTVRHLLEGLHAEGVPWLVIEPAKAEYAGMAGRIGAPISVIRPGNPDAVPVGINPLEPAPGFPLQTHIDFVRALFLAAFDAIEPFPQVLSHALTRCYRDLGWDLIVSRSRYPGITPKYPTLTDLQTAALQVVDGIGYSREITDNVRGFIDVRLGSLRLGTPGRFFEGEYRLDTAVLLAHNTVLEIEDIGNDADKAFFIGAILIRLFEHLRLHHQDVGTDTALTHVTVIEEAHRLLRRPEPGTPAAYAVELFTSLLAEIRAYGEGIIVAEQIPTKISPDVVKNTALKIVHRLPAAEDRDLIGATMNLDPTQSRHVVSLPAGRAVVFTDGMDHPLRVDVPLGRTREARTSAPVPALTPTPTQSPLLLRDLHRAHRVAEDPYLIIWIELLVLAHLVGRPSPRPDHDWLASLSTAVPPAILSQAIRLRINHAIDERYPGLCSYFQPEDLAEHLIHSAHATLNNAAPVCVVAEPQWQAGRYRWADIESALHDTGLPPQHPHPDTAVWNQRGIVLPHAALEQQLAVLHTHPDNRADRRIVTGRSTPSLLETTLAGLSDTAALEQRLHQATPHLHLTSPWPLALLTDEATGNPPL
ncbi:ATP-binding protein [Nocardia goodfellowii]